MKKVFLAAVLVAGSYVAANAQSKEPGDFQLGAGLKVALPIGDFGDASSFGIGAEGQAEYLFAKEVSAVGSVGYTHYIEKNNSGSGGVIPVLVGARFYPTSEFFVGAKVGVAFFTQSGSGSAFNYIPQVGYNADKFQLALGYDAFSKNSSTISSIALTGIVKF